MSDSDTTKRLDTAGGPPDRPDEILSTGSPSTHGSGLAMSRQEPFQTTMDPLQVHTIPTSSSASLPMGAASQTMPGACPGQSADSQIAHDWCKTPQAAQIAGQPAPWAHQQQQPPNGWVPSHGQAWGPSVPPTPVQMQGPQMPASAPWSQYAPQFATPQMPYTPQMWSQAQAQSQYVSPPQGQFFGGHNPYGTSPACQQGPIPCGYPPSGWMPMPGQGQAYSPYMQAAHFDGGRMLLGVQQPQTGQHEPEQRTVRSTTEVSQQCTVPREELKPEREESAPAITEEVSSHIPRQYFDNRHAATQRMARMLARMIRHRAALDFADRHNIGALRPEKPWRHELRLTMDHVDVASLVTASPSGERTNTPSPSSDEMQEASGRQNVSFETEDKPFVSPHTNTLDEEQRQNITYLAARWRAAQLSAEMQRTPPFSEPLTLPGTKRERDAATGADAPSVLNAIPPSRSCSEPQEAGTMAQRLTHLNPSNSPVYTGKMAEACRMSIHSGDLVRHRYGHHGM